MNLADWRAAGVRFHWSGQPIFLREQPSDQPPMLLIHGFPTASYDWHRLWPTLAEYHSLIAPDMIGFGFSAKPRDYRYSIMDQANLFEGLLADRDIRECRVLAHDYGDTVAQELLARQLEDRLAFRITAVDFLNGGLIPDAHRPRLIQKLLISPLGPLVSRLINERSFRRSFEQILAIPLPEEEMAAIWALVSHDHGTRIAHRLIRYMAERKQHAQRWVGALQRSTVPLRLIDGIEDPVSGGHLVARFRELVPNATVIELPGVGHYPQLEAPEQVLAALGAPTSRTAMTAAEQEDKEQKHR